MGGELAELKVILEAGEGATGVAYAWLGIQLLELLANIGFMAVVVYGLYRLFLFLKDDIKKGG